MFKHWHLHPIVQEEDIRLYSCLANGSADEFVKGEHMLKIKAVKDPLQIGESSSGFGLVFVPLSDLVVARAACHKLILI